MTKQAKHADEGDSSGWKWSAAVIALVSVAAAVYISAPGSNTSPWKENFHPSVKLEQATVVGRLIDDGTYPKPLEAFMGIPFALPPVGSLRFRPAVPVPSGNGTLHAYYYGPRCPGRQLVPFLPSDFLGPDYESEDCLTINIFRPSELPPGKKLPVSVLIPGGAFNRGAARMHDTHSMLAHSSEPFIAVSMQYRIGVFGGLNNELTAKEGALNLGLRDMYASLEWVQENIAAFGGDPDDVTIMGLSAAAHGIGHLIMDINQPKRLFHKAIMDSGAHTARAIHKPSSSLHRQHFREMLDLTPCKTYTDLLDPAILECLRNIPGEIIDYAGKEIFDRSNPSIRWAWQPVMDGQIISRRPVNAWRSGKWNKVPILTGSAHNEGAYYVPRSMDKSQEFLDFFRTLLPHISDAEIQELDSLYPDPAKDPASPYLDISGDPKTGRQFRRAEAAYGHYAYTCPVRQTVIYASSHNPSDPPAFLYHWALNKTALYGANHGDQMRYQTYNPEVRSISTMQNEVTGSFHAYCTSFILRGDPSAISQGPFSHRPGWKSFSNGKGKTMLLGEGNDERAGGTGVGTAAALKDYTWADKECDFWWRISEKWEED